MRAKPEAGTELDQLIARYAMKGVEAPYSTNTGRRRPGLAEDRGPGTIRRRMGPDAHLGVP